MDAYIYAADIYCEDCGRAIRDELIKEGRAPANPDDERSYDSGEFPKGPYPDGGGESDSPQHCASQAECVNRIEFPDGVHVGCWLENELTTAGVKYVIEAIKEGGDVARLWQEYYKDYEGITYPFKVWFRWGGPPLDWSEHAFATEAELVAFLEGVSAMDGYLSSEQFDTEQEWLAAQAEHNQEDECND